jgi:hypothetical protein
MRSDVKIVVLDAAEAMSLVAQAPFGRLVFTIGALPAVQPVNHIVDGGEVIIRAALGPAPDGANVTDPVVAFQVDDYDPETGEGWNVVVTGLARSVVEPERVAHYQQLLPPWSLTPTDAVYTIRPDLVRGHVTARG